MEKKVSKIIVIILALLTGPVFSQMGMDSPGFSISPSMKSILLPGLGEYSLGETKRGRVFLLTEVTLITSAVVSAVWADYETSSLKSYAADYGAANTGIKNDQYWVDIGNYMSRDAYNDEHLRWRDFEGLYISDEQGDWNWQSESHRSKYRNIRVNRDRIQQTTKFIIGAVVLNHVVSAIDALYLARVRLDPEISYYPVYDPINGSMNHTLSVRF